MADETILEQAVAMIPGMGKPKRGRKKSSAADWHFSTIQKSIAELTDAVGKLGEMVMGKPAKPARKTAAKRGTTAARKASTAKRGTAKRSTARAKPRTATAKSRRSTKSK